MNILQLCDNYREETNFGEVLKHFNYKIINKYNFFNVSLVSYDAFIITVDILEQYEENKAFFQDLEKQKKPIIYIYHGNNKSQDIGMKFLAKKYNLKFQLSDCSVLDTPNWNYKPEVDLSEDVAYSMVSKNGEKNCFVKNTKNFYIYKNKNVIIMHDLAISFDSQHQLDKSRLANMIKYILQTNEAESTIHVDWLANVQIINDEELNNQYLKNEEQLKNIQKQQQDIQNEIEKNNYYKALLYYSGEKLVDVVENILEEMLNVKIYDKDLKKQDLHFKLDTTNMLVEIKGVNHPFQRDNISQVKRHIKDFAEEHEIYGADVDKKCKGVLILNPYSLHDLKEKISKKFYSKEVIEDIKYENICTLDTITLLNYYSKWKKDSKSIDLKQILLSSNYNKPDYDEIIKL